MSEKSSNEFSLFQKNNLGNSCESTDKTTGSKMAITNYGIDAAFNKLVEDVFHFTMIPVLDKEFDTPVIYLPDLYELLKTNITRRTELELLEQAIFERTLLLDPQEYILKNKHNVTITTHTVQKECIFYLFKCFIELTFAKQENRYPSIEEDTYSKIFDFLSTNVSTALKQPDLYCTQNIHEQILGIFETNMASFEEYVNFFVLVNKKIILDEDDSDAQMKSIYKPILKKVKEKILQATIIFLPITEISTLQVFSAEPLLANVLIDDCYVPDLTPGFNYTDTVLGAAFAISVLPQTPGGQYEHFQKPIEDVAGHLESNIWSGMEKLHKQLHKIFLYLLKAGPEVKHKTLLWLGRCLEKNSGRCKLWNVETSLLGFISDGFALNLSTVLLRLCQPFISNSNNPKLLKIDPTYCVVKIQNNEQSRERGVHLWRLNDSTMLLPIDSDSENDNPSEDRPIAQGQFNFITECFYMTQKSLEMGFALVAEKVITCNQELGRLQQTFLDAQSTGSTPTEVMKLINERIENEMKKYLSLKAALLEPSTLHLMSLFQKATCVWLTQVVLDVDKDYQSNDLQSYCPTKFKPIEFPLPTIIPPTLKCIPEFLLENIWRYLTLVRRFHPRSLEEPGEESTLVSELLNAILIFMTSNSRVRNPHLRARLAECLDCLLPHTEEDTVMATNYTGIYNRKMLFLNHPHRKQIVHALLDVFVGIEMTGQSVEFEQKFNYRRPMYVVMDYLWKLEEHREVFKSLAKDAENNMEAASPPLFLRFINLLMNDAVFLLDEALTNMAQLRQMQTAHESGEWSNLSHRERTQNLSYLQHIGMIARFDNILGKETINTLKYLTTEIKSIFCHSTMVDRVAAMLNYFLCHLVGPKKKNFKVKDMKEYKFEPAEIVLDICAIYLNLGESEHSEAFCLAISRDGRSYNSQLFKQTEHVLAKIGGAPLIDGITSIAKKVSELGIQSNDEELLLSEAPETFLDPIMSTLMMDPVILPSSKMNVDRSTIARHLLSDQTDPFNRSHLTMDMVITNVELKNQIEEWIKIKKSQK